jgi:Kyakuja-Dileera-Zisupton transposase
LEGEAALTFEMLVTMDGNNSLKRVLRRGPAADEAEVGPTNERPTGKVLQNDYYLSREQVDKYAKDIVDQAVLGAELDEDENPCEDRWTNMTNELVARMWGIFDETGVFLALCRHGFILVILDMVQSGELYVP